MEFNHISVLLNESVAALNVKPEGVYLDGTLGGGGHSSLICEKLGESGTLSVLTEILPHLMQPVKNLKNISAGN